MPEVSGQSKIVPRGIVVKKDKQEEEYEQFLKLWLDNKINYETLMNRLPDQYKSIWKRFLEYLAAKST